MISFPVRRKISIAIAVLAGLVAVAVPVAVSLEIVIRQAREAEFSRLGAIAAEILRRSEETRAQIVSASAALRGPSANPCSEERIAQMREVDIRSTYLQAVGYVANNRLMCSSLGNHGEGIDLGEAAARRQSGIRSWLAISLPPVPGQVLNIYEHDGIASVVHPDLVIDIGGSKSGVSMALIALKPTQLVRSRGTVRPAWISRAGQDSTFIDGDYLVSIKAAPNGFVASLAAAPVSTVSERMRELAMIVVPIGVISGIVLALAVFTFARQFLSMASSLRAALRRNEFFVLYQPIVELRGGFCIGAEALIRWRRSDGILVRPDFFIPIAEESGLIHDVTKRVIDIVARDTSALLKLRPDLHIGINLSPLDLQTHDTPRIMQDLIRRAGVKPENFLVEASERGFMQAEVAREVLGNIRALKVRIAIDDFGTGYSNLSHLESFKLDYLKIDKSFVDTMGGDTATSQVAFHIIEMAKALKLEMIAEGVETSRQVKFLQERGVQYAQGWFFAKPMAVEEFAAFVEASEKLAA